MIDYGSDNQRDGNRVSLVLANCNARVVGLKSLTLHRQSVISSGKTHSAVRSFLLGSAIEGGICFLLRNGDAGGRNDRAIFILDNHCQRQFAVVSRIRSRINLEGKIELSNLMLLHQHGLRQRFEARKPYCDLISARCDLRDGEPASPVREAVGKLFFFSALEDYPSLGDDGAGGIDHEQLQAR
jgi:hypothetical protein